MVSFPGIFFLSIYVRAYFPFFIFCFIFFVKADGNLFYCSLLIHKLLVFAFLLSFSAFFCCLHAC